MFTPMERNKHVYAFDAALVVACTDDKGGTWSGARALRHGQVPVFVKITGGVRMGTGNFMRAQENLQLGVDKHPGVVSESR